MDQRTTNTRAQKERRYPPGYGVVEPVANYRPWDVDQEFEHLRRSVVDHTMVDTFRLWILFRLAQQLQAPGDVLEVGSWRGGSGALLASVVAPRAVFLADTFRGIVKAGARDTYYKGGEHANTSPDIVATLADTMGLTNVVGVFPDQTADRISDRRFAFCHIDVDVYQSARDAFVWVWPRMVAGGIVVFDDYGFYGCEGVTSFVEELMAEHSAVVIPNLSGQAIIVKTTD
jgi:O-methyltransferase